MRISIFFLVILNILTISVHGQGRVDNAYLLRQLTKKDSSVRIPNTGTYLLTNAGLKKEPFGWLLEDDFVKTDSNMLYFEMNTTDVSDGPWSEYTPGSVQLAINISKGITALNFDTISRLKYQLINNYTGFTRTSNTVNILSGIITIQSNEKNEKIIDGTITIISKDPVTRQQIVFNNYLIPSLTLEEYAAEQAKQKEIKAKETEKMWGALDLVSKERRLFYDSVFDKKKYKGNKLNAKFNNGKEFAFSLDNSYLLLGALMTDSVKADMSELLGGNFLVVVEGDKYLFRFHSFYDPAKNIFDDEINFSLSIELDSIIPGKTYHANEFATKLAYWHYGPFSQVIYSTTTTGTFTITESNNILSKGTLDLQFKNSNKTNFSLKGSFELPKLKFSAVTDLENKIKLKLIRYYSRE